MTRSTMFEEGMTSEYCALEKVGDEAIEMRSASFAELTEGRDLEMQLAMSKEVLTEVLSAGKGLERRLAISKEVLTEVPSAGKGLAK